MKDRRVTVRLSADLHRHIKDAAQAKGARDSDIIRDALEQRFAEKPNVVNAFDRAKRAGLIGAVKSESPDLSANPKYFEGFGDS